MDLLKAKEEIEKELKKDVIVHKRFLGGMSNFTYLIEFDKELYTYRIPGKNSHVFIDREIESRNIDLVKSLELNCENIYLNNDNGHKLSKYIDGDYNLDIIQVSKCLKKLHNSKIRAVNDYIKKDKLNYYESLVSEKHTSMYIELKEEFLLLDKDYENIPLVFTHGDAQQSNWVNSDKLYLLDWEYSGNNDFYYDIACYGNVNFDDAVKLLEVYLERKPSNEELKRLYFNRYYQCLQWHNVALYKHEIGLSIELSMDFKMISEKYLVLATDFLMIIKGL